MRQTSGAGSVGGASHSSVLTQTLPTCTPVMRTRPISPISQRSSRGHVVLYLHYVEGRSFEQIAELLDLRSASVRQTANRARRQLRLTEGVTP